MEEEFGKASGTGGLPGAALHPGRGTSCRPAPVELRPRLAAAIEPSLSRGPSHRLLVSSRKVGERAFALRAMTTHRPTDRPPQKSKLAPLAVNNIPVMLESPRADFYHIPLHTRHISNAH